MVEDLEFGDVDGRTGIARNGGLWRGSCCTDRFCCSLSSDGFGEDSEDIGLVLRDASFVAAWWNMSGSCLVDAHLGCRVSNN